MSNVVNFLSGTTWTYRSFLNMPDPSIKPDDLLFGQGEMAFENTNAQADEVNGYFDFGSGYKLNFKGWGTLGTPYTFRFQGVGIPDSPTEGWAYDYLCYYAPSWPNGVDQVPALVGTMVRTNPHSDGRAKAGVVASFIAVKVN